LWEDHRAMVAVAHDGAGPLLGRDGETETLRSLLDGIERGGGALVLRGEPGIGKSRRASSPTSMPIPSEMGLATHGRHPGGVRRCGT
jgi:hypothetical protein